MKLAALVAGDVKIQFRYGIYGLYLVFSVLYIGLLFALPESWRERAAVMLIFTDPSAMGLYFMGAIVLFEKGERALNALAVSPVLPLAYTLSKLVSIAVISTSVAAAIGLSSGAVPVTAGFTAGAVLGSCLFSAVGLIVAARSRTLNGFILRTIPYELAINLPAFGYLFGLKVRWLFAHPGVAIVALYRGDPVSPLVPVVLVVWTALATMLAVRASSRMFRTMGGMKL